MLAKQTSSTIEWIKWVAIILMVIDHIGLVFYDNNPIFRSIGRMAFPMFGYLLIHNYIYFTNDKKNYIKRLFIFAIISQPFYALVIGSYLNIFILLAMVLLTIYLIEKISIENKSRYTISGRMMQVAIFTYVGFISLFTGYGIRGFIFFMTLYFVFKNKKYKTFLLLGMITLSYGKWFYAIGVYGSIGVIYLLQHIPYEIKRTNKWFFYVFYPLHLLCLYIVKEIIQ